MKIYAMTFNRNTALRKLKGYDDVFTEHISKLILYSDIMPEYKDDWFGDIGRAIHNMSRTAAHSDLKQDDYYYNCFDGFGDCTIDDAAATLANEAIRLSRKKSNPFPRVDYTEDQAALASDIFALFQQELSEYLAETKSVIPIKDAVEFTKSIFKVGGFDV